MEISENKQIKQAKGKQRNVKPTKYVGGKFRQKNERKRQIKALEKEKELAELKAKEDNKAEAEIIKFGWVL